MAATMVASHPGGPPSPRGQPATLRPKRRGNKPNAHSPSKALAHAHEVEKARKLDLELSRSLSLLQRLIHAANVEIPHILLATKASGGALRMLWCAWAGTSFHIWQLQRNLLRQALTRFFAHFWTSCCTASLPQGLAGTAGEPAGKLRLAWRAAAAADERRRGSLRR